jgi:glutamate synthase (NADPH/NADH) large chain
MGLTALENLEHRGASGSEPDSGDGAGILIQVPDALWREVTDFDLPAAGHYATGIVFLSADANEAQVQIAELTALAVDEGLEVLGWREVPTDPTLVGTTAKSVMPSFWQVFVSAVGQRQAGLELDRVVYGFRKRSEHESGAYFASLSARTMVFKGMLTTGQLTPFYPDLTHPAMSSALALVHSRFSTNTFPSWPLAHPYRLIAHNGEINTVKGNRNWMKTREALLTSDVLPGDLTRLFPIC